MKTVGIIILSLILQPAAAPAQDGGVSKCERAMILVEERFAARERERRETEAAAQRQMARRAAGFVAKWNDFVEKYNRGLVDAKAANELSRAFRRLEKSAAWPGPRSVDEPEASPTLAAK